MFKDNAGTHYREACWLRSDRNQREVYWLFWCNNICFSDDRTAKVFESRILNAIEMKSVLNDKPNCLIIDEIDGITDIDGEVASSLTSLTRHESAIEVLVKLASGELKKGKSAAVSLQRPIICICNNQYARQRLC
jgi:hypothetical protein